MSNDTNTTSTATVTLNAALFEGWQLEQIAFRILCEKEEGIDGPLERWLLKESNQKFLAAIGEERFEQVLAEASMDAWLEEEEADYRPEPPCGEERLWEIFTSLEQEAIDRNVHTEWEAWFSKNLSRLLESPESVVSAKLKAMLSKFEGCHLTSWWRGKDVWAWNW